MVPRSSRALGLLLACLAALLGALPSTAAALDDAGLRRVLDRETAKLGTSSAALVVDVDAGTVLYSRRPDLPLVPASNQKLLTTAAALVRFGPDGTLATTVRTAPGEEVDADGVLDGDLHLVGSGDPSLGDTGLARLADELTANGLERVTGGVRGDERAFDTLRGGPDSAFRPDLDLGGWLGALVVNHGRAFPGGPAQVAASRLQALLKARGVRFGRQARAGGLPRKTAAAAAGPPLASLPSPPMQRLITTTNVPSDNFYAEMLVKVLGHEFGAAGTHRAGLAVMRSTLAQLGVRPRLADGSGLSRANRLTARQAVSLLRAMRARADFAAFHASLPRPGVSGTLRKRMRGTAASRRCRAKTGTLRGVSALSGYCTAADGRLLAFSLLENGVYNVFAKQVEDRMVPAIASYDGG